MSERARHARARFLKRSAIICDRGDKIAACHIGFPPVEVDQEREAFLLRELQAMLDAEGLIGSAKDVTPHPRGTDAGLRPPLIGKLFWIVQLTFGHSWGWANTKFRTPDIRSKTKCLMRFGTIDALQES